MPVPRQLRAIKEGVGEKASAPQSAEIELRFSSEISRTKEQSYFRSPTENHQKSINPPKPKLTEAPNTTILIAPPNKPRRLAERLGGFSLITSPLPDSVHVFANAST